MDSLIRYRYILIAISAALIFIIDFINLDVLPVSYHWDTKLLFFIHVASFIRSLKYIKLLNLPLPLILTFFSAINYGYVFFVIPRNEYQLAWMNYMTVGILIWFFLVFYSIYFITLDVKLKKIQFYGFMRSAETMTSSPGIIKWALLLLYMFDLVVGIPISGFSEVIANLVIGIFFVYFLHGKSKWYENVLFCVILLFLFYQAFFSGFGYAILYLVIYLLSIFLIVGKFNDRLLNALLVFLGIMALFLMNLISSNKMFLRTENSLSALEKINYLLESTENSREEIDDLKNTTIWRASYQASALSFVMENTPSKIPYWDGASYVNVVLKFIPRFLWPNKPKEDMGQRFGHTYGITRTSDTRTSMNTPILAESYMNYSYFGFFLLVIILTFTLVNVFFQINIRGNSKSDSRGFVDKICLAQFGLYVTQWESNFSMMLGKIVILFFIRWTLIKLPYFFMRLE